MNVVQVEGFILQATYRVQHQVPVVHLFGRLTDGRTFMVRDNRCRPYFYVESKDCAAASNARVEASSYRAFNQAPVAKVEVGIPADAPVLRESLHAQGIRTFEADVPFATRYLMDRGIRGGVYIKGQSRAGQGTDLIIDNPDLAPAQVDIQPTVMAFDIETNGATNELLAIACYADQPGSAASFDRVVIVDPKGRPMPERATGVKDERAALAWFATQVRRLDPDILTGWNVIDFDLSVLARVARRVGYDLQLGRQQGSMRIRPPRGYFGSGHAMIPGRLVLDGIELLRSSFISMDSYSLDAVASSVLGEGKTLGETGEEKVAAILDRYHHALSDFSVYARTDARLALQIIERLNLIQLSMARSALTGMPPDRVAASIASFDFLYLSQLSDAQRVAPSVGQHAQSTALQAGGAVFEPIVGLHKSVWVFDFKSLYPSIIRTFNIDPLSYAEAPLDDQPIRTHEGSEFSRAPAILPRMLARLFPLREAAKASNDDITAHAIKILMNSFYGVLGAPSCRFFNPAMANAITGEGRYLLNWARDWFKQQGYEVLYGDTDSVFVASALSDPIEAQARARVLATAFNADLGAHLKTTAGVESHLELEFEKLYTQLFLASVRGGEKGARKRYVGQRMGQTELEFVGMEVVRRDWTALAKRVQHTLYTRLFAGEPVVEYLKETAASLRQGELDGLLVYRKGLRKPVETYTSHVPLHVQALKKSKSPVPRVVSFVMTIAGPELRGEQRSPLDREHYLNRQVKPVAEPVLEVLGLEFDQVIGDDRQIGLF